jgi:hypothetical protein
MPTVIRIGHFRFHFYSDEGSEPPHIHVRSPDGECKFWLEPMIICNRSGGNQENELHGIGWNHYEQAVVIDFIANNSE